VKSTGSSTLDILTFWPFTFNVLRMYISSGCTPMAPNESGTATAAWNPSRVERFNPSADAEKSATLRPARACRPSRGPAAAAGKAVSNRAIAVRMRLFIIVTKKNFHLSQTFRVAGAIPATERHGEVYIVPNIGIFRK